MLTFFSWSYELFLQLKSESSSPEYEYLTWSLHELCIHCIKMYTWLRIYWNGTMTICCCHWVVVCDGNKFMWCSTNFSSALPANGYSIYISSMLINNTMFINALLICKKYFDITLAYVRRTELIWMQSDLVRIKFRNFLRSTMRWWSC